MKNLDTPLSMTSRKPFRRTTYELRTAANYIILESGDRQYLEDIMTACNAHDDFVSLVKSFKHALSVHLESGGPNETSTIRSLMHLLDRHTESHPDE